MRLFISLFILTLALNATAGDRFNRVLLIVLGNADYNAALKQPYLKTLSNEGALLSNFKALAYGSQQNYVGLIAGATYNVKNNNVVDLPQRHIGDLLEEKNKTWKMYAEDYPGNCFKGKTKERYVRFHAPFISFRNVSTSKERCKKIVEGKEFFADLKSKNLPDFSLYIPNLDNSGHETNLSYADAYLRSTFDQSFRSADFPKDLLVVVTFDQGTLLGRNNVLTILWGANVSPGEESRFSYNHYSLLRTIQDELELGSLNQNDVKALSIDDVWK